MANTSIIKNTCIPKFADYVCVGDSITWKKDGFTFTASIHADSATTPYDFGGHSSKKIKEWENNQWFFCGIIVSATKGGIVLSENVANLWGLVCNYNKNSSRYLRTVCMDLQDDALSEANLQIQKIVQALMK